MKSLINICLYFKSTFIYFYWHMHVETFLNYFHTSIDIHVSISSHDVWIFSYLIYKLFPTRYTWNVVILVALNLKEGLFILGDNDALKPSIYGKSALMYKLGHNYYYYYVIKQRLAVASTLQTASLLSQFVITNIISSQWKLFHFILKFKKKMLFVRRILWCS